MKMRVLTETKKGKMLAIADIVTEMARATGADKKTDVIMPAYPCDRERLVVIVATAKPTMSDSFCRFVKAMTKDIASNVAFIIDGTPENAAKILDMARSAGTNVIDDVLYIKGGLPFKFIKSVTDEEVKAVKAWTEKIMASIN